MPRFDGGDEPDSGRRAPFPGDAFWNGLEKAARAVGLGSPRTLFRLRQARARWEERGAARENLERGVAYTHKACPGCGRLVERGSGRCPYCDANVRWAPGPGLARSLGLSVPHGSVAMTIVVMNIILFAISTLASARSLDGGIGPNLMRTLFQPDLRSLYNMGALSPLAVFSGEVWRLWTYQFLHGGALHIFFNLFALFSLGPTTEDVYGPSKTAVLYWVTGTLAGVASLAVKILMSGRIALVPLTVGASGAIFGLIGLLIGHATRRGGAHGAYLRSFLVRWALYGIVMGFLIGADNAAHVGGLAAGLALGFIVPEGESPRRAGSIAWRLAAVGVLLLTVGGFIAAVFAPHA
jgi:rhomboid protease GluP